jgi:alanine racemase
MPDLPPPTLRLTIDTDALAHNWRSLDAMSGTAKAGAAVKANCYGLGVDICVPILRDAGARDFFVAHWSEVPPVLRHVPPEQVAVLHGVVTREEADYARALGVLPVIDSLRQAEIWQAAGGGPCHLMVDTGINRLGIRPDEARSDAIRALDIHALLSHLACADEDSAMNADQLRAFESVRERIPHRIASLANSAGIALGANYHYDLTRPGLALYGGVPRPELRDVIRQVARPEARLIAVRKLERGDTVGYNALFTAPDAMRIGIVSLGYADGILRSWGDAVFTHDGTDLPILGRISMDMIALDLGKAPDLGEGDWVVLPYDLPEAASRTGLSQYEQLTLLGNRFERALT